MCWPGLPSKGLACHCCQQKCSRRCLWRGAGTLEGAQDHPSLSDMATSHQHWASLSPLALARGPPHLCAPPVCRMELGDGWTRGRHSRNMSGAVHTWRDHKMPWVYGPVPLEPPPCCFPTRWEKNTPRAHWRAWDEVCETQGCKELLRNTVGLGSAPPGIQVWDQLQSRSYSLTSSLSQARKRGTVL